MKFPRLAGVVAIAGLGCLPASLLAQAEGNIEQWLTTADRSALLARQSAALHFTIDHGELPAITVDDAQPRQKMDGFGFALTGGSAQLLMRMSPQARTALLTELFSANAPNTISVSYLRVSIGSSDMNDHVFTYDDLPAGEQDPQLAHFDLGPDKTDVIPVLKEILAINPAIKLLASPWSAPSWMKTNDAPKAGSLRPEFYPVYAHYLVKYLQAMAAEGIHINTLTVQNEPLNKNNTPSMYLPAEEEDAFIKNALGPALAAAGLRTGIILYDHNCDRPDYPLQILADPAVSKYVLGSGFHLYGGDVSAMSKVHDAYPQKGLYFTEQMIIEKPGELPFKIQESVSRVVIGATRNWAENVLLWNLAADPHNGPHTSDGGCPICQGAVTLDGDTVSRNLAFYTIAQVSKFVPPGSVRIQSTGPAENDLAEVAFERPDGKKVLLVANRTAAPYTFEVRFHSKAVHTTLPAGAVSTYIWQ
jgi:glucosylceramidase